MMFSASVVLAVGICLGIFLGPTVAIQGGTKVDRCDFPGLAVALVNDTIACHGVVVGNKFLMPSECNQLFALANNDKRNTVVTTITTEKTVWFIANGLFTSTFENGYHSVDLSKFTINSTIPDDCFKEGELYNAKDKLKMDSCVVVGFATGNGSSVVYNPANAVSAPITKSTSAACCKAVDNTGLIKYTELDGSHHINCLVSTGKTCGMSDVGSPVMCDTESGKKVTIALTAAPSCDKDEMFIVHDLTKRSDDVKFGDFAG